MCKWLNDYQKLKDETIYLEYNLHRSKRELKRWIGGDLLKYKLVPDSDGTKVENHIERIEYELAYKMNDLHDLKKLIRTFKGLEHKIIYGKYVEGKRLDEIAGELNYSA
ncbi:hypothetical protein P4283_29660, partial [Bacillus thuringiensis]|nr:hypothetical protein [Bacillus thuringiensis]